MSEIVTGGIEQAPPEVIAQLCKFFRNQEIAECAAVESRQKRIEKFLSRDRKSMNGLGQPVMELDEFVIGHWRNRLGYNPLKDSGWRKYMLKKHPEIRVHALGTKEIHVGWSPGLETTIGKKFYSKSYG